MRPLCPTCRGDCCSNESGSLVVAHGAAFSLHRCPDCPDGFALAIDLAAARLNALLEAERENTALRAEVMYLRAARAGMDEWLRTMVPNDKATAAERAAVVAWLYRNHYDDTAARIERGEHRREEEK